MADDFRQMLTAILPQMRSFAIMKAGNRSDADDLLQQTAMKALRAEKQFVPGSNLKAWLYCILKNEFVNSIRRKKPMVNIDDLPEELMATRASQEDKVLKRELLNAMDKLPEAQRDVMITICAGGMDYAEAALALECSIQTIKSRLWRARGAMRKFLTEETPVSICALSISPALALAAH